MLRLSILLLFLGAIPGLASGQADPAVSAAAPIATPPATGSSSDFAPGVETVIPPALDPAETVTRHDMVEIGADKSLEWQPKLTSGGTLLQQAKDARFPRDLWALEFGFKPLRMMRFQDPSTKSGQRLVWYLVYRVKNTGAALRPTMNEADGEFTAAKVDSGPVRFLPHFVLQGHDVGPDGGKIYRAYLDQALPEAVAAIAKREAPKGQQLYTTTTMPLKPLAVGESRWGVAMWSDLDPEIDFFSVYVRGLTNAYDWTDPAGAFKVGDPPGKGREFVRKTLQLNFWRPGDRFMQHESEVRYGVAPGKAALYGVGEGVAYRWVYR